MKRFSDRLAHDPDVLPWLGVNFWSRTGGPLMWRSYDPRTVREELRVLREHGLNMTRSFFYWPDFMPTPYTVDEALCVHFADFLDAHREYGMKTVPTFIVGHMSGENWDPSWRGGRDLYGDVWMVSRQAWFAKEMTRRFHRHPAITGWLVSNEMPIYGRVPGQDPAPREHVNSWAEAIVNAVRATGAPQPVSLGDGAWGMEVMGKENGFSLRETAELIDFAGPHVYRMENDRIRQHHRAAFECELAAVARKPVILEEFGLSTDFVSEENAGVYYRQTLHHSLLAGATGWIAWNNTDYDALAAQPPYDHHGFEMHFGVTDTQGRPKAPLRELAAFSEVLEQVDFGNCRRADSDAALIVPAFLERGFPVGYAADRPVVFESLRQGYTAAREADLPPVLVREQDGLPEGPAAEGVRLHLLPSTRQLLAPTRRHLERLARGGATVYLSYCSGEQGTTRGPWFQDLNGLFGVELQLSYGLAEPIEDDTVELTFTEDFGSIAAGETLRFDLGGYRGSDDSRAFLPVVPTGSRVVATDGHGRPAVLRHALGEGETVLCTYPLEYLAARTPRVNPEQTYRLYEALAEVAGASRPVRTGTPLVSADALVHEDGRRFVWLISQAAERTTVRPGVDGSLHELGTGKETAAVELEPYGVRVLELRGASGGV
ncbi:cellulase family glycosylhydrolase [Streptomyces sp. ODS28]|uniref:cellulase family glycosylhydrolase n=1 Tax=Streptomyces sp. ODS28 TaxID=3136688 RepID=UPI0031EB3DDD